MKRIAAVAGSFYPGVENQLKKQVDELMDEVSSIQEQTNVRALIVPHAGYVYSGTVAAAAYHQVAGQKYDTIFLLGASHKATFKGAATCGYTDFETPLGEVSVNQAIVNELISGSSAVFRHDEIHQNEHSLEVQLPFIQRVIGDFKDIVPIIIGNDVSESQTVAGLLKPYFNASNLFVVSTDFSHYPPAGVAELEDVETARIICSNSSDALLAHLAEQKQSNQQNLLTGLCGWSAVLTLLAITKDLPVVFHSLLYQHSGMKLYKDASRVVGYNAIAICAAPTNTGISDKDRAVLLDAARDAIRHHLGVHSNYETSEGKVTLSSAGAFVSVYVKGELRGCVGQFNSEAPLDELVREQAVHAASYDSRFKAIGADELDKLRIEISILTPLRLVKDIDEIEMGRHGIFIKKGLSHGTFLPQVGVRNDWTVEEYLGRCARDKARIGWDGWREAEIYVYEALIISDKDD